MPNKLKDPVRHKFTRKHYNKRDWKAYDQALVGQGSLTIWFNEEAVAQWNNARLPNQPKGRPRLYSDLAIQTCHTLRFLNKKGLRQTQGYVASIISLMGLPLQTPDHTTISRRLQTIKIPRQPSTGSGSTVVVVDSSGLKVMGEKEWMNYKHGTRQRKVWRKLHIAVNEAGEIIAHELTAHITGDASTVAPLLAQIEQPIAEFIGDGGYDQQPTYDAIDNHAAKYRQSVPRIVVPPNTGFKSMTADDHDARKQNQQIITEQGRQRWQKDTNYGRRAVSENTFSRYKTIIGNKIHSKHEQSQKNEVHLGVIVLNTFHKMGMPKSKIAA